MALFQYNLLCVVCRKTYNGIKSSERTCPDCSCKLYKEALGEYLEEKGAMSLEERVRAIEVWIFEKKYKL